MASARQETSRLEEAFDVVLPVSAKLGETGRETARHRPAEQRVRWRD
jgi:hypothetical protein